MPVLHEHEIVAVDAAKNRRFAYYNYYCRLCENHVRNVHHVLDHIRCIEHTTNARVGIITEMFSVYLLLWLGTLLSNSMCFSERQTETATRAYSHSRCYPHRRDRCLDFFTSLATPDISA